VTVKGNAWYPPSVRVKLYDRAQDATQRDSAGLARAKVVLLRLVGLAEVPELKSIRTWCEKKSSLLV
jgi:hypothetical protein